MHVPSSGPFPPRSVSARDIAPANHFRRRAIGQRVDPCPSSAQSHRPGTFSTLDRQSVRALRLGISPCKGVERPTREALDARMIGVERQADAGLPRRFLEVTPGDQPVDERFAPFGVVVNRPAAPRSSTCGRFRARPGGSGLGLEPEPFAPRTSRHRWGRRSMQARRNFVAGFAPFRRASRSRSASKSEERAPGGRT